MVVTVQATLPMPEICVVNMSGERVLVEALDIGSTVGALRRRVAALLCCQRLLVGVFYIPSWFFTSPHCCPVLLRAILSNYSLMAAPCLVVCAGP